MTEKDEAELRAEHAVDDPDVWGEPEPIPKAGRLDVTISVRFTAKEIATVRERAAAAGMRPTAFIRQAALNRDAPPIDREALRQALSVISSEVATIKQVVEPSAGRKLIAPRRPKRA